MEKTIAEFSALLERVRTGCPEATADLVRNFGPAIRRVVRSRLHGRLRTAFDSTDFTQDVWLKLFAEQLHRRHFDSAEQLLSFLVKMARNHVLNLNQRYLDTQKHDLRRLESLDLAGAAAAHDRTAPSLSPLDGLIRREEWDRVLEAFPPLERLSPRRRITKGHAAPSGSVPG